MATKEITVTLDEDDWRALSAAADCAGMSVEAYASWGVRLLAMQARPGRPLRHDAVSGSKAVLRASGEAEEPDSVAWTETFAERLSHRTGQFRND